MLDVDPKTTVVRAHNLVARRKGGRHEYDCLESEDASTSSNGAEGDMAILTTIRAAVHESTAMGINSTVLHFVLGAPRGFLFKLCTPSLSPESVIVD